MKDQLRDIAGHFALSISAALAVALSGHLGYDLLHFGIAERAHRLRADVAQDVRCQQHTGGRLIVRCLDD
ncbi:MAG TPA: hypothetical protein VIS53_00375 [Candidatus Udaeobacter sp.]